MKGFLRFTALFMPVLALILIVASGTIACASPPANLNSPLGMNTNEALEVDSSIPFVDLFRYALPFDEARPWFTKGNVKFDANGWPQDLNGGKAGTRFLAHIPVQALPQGEYTVLYQGQGEIRYGASAKLIKRLPGKDIIRLVPMPQKGELYKTYTATLFIEKTNPKNYIRNIQIIMPGGICKDNPFRYIANQSQCRGSSFLPFEKYARQIIFNPEFLNYMKDFKVIRFMNMAGITRNNVRSWAERPTINKATWGGKEGVRGVPLEIMIRLANILNADPWFNIPHNADNTYVFQFAQMVKNQLRPNLRVYIEYSNEAWNNIFVPQAEHMKQSGYKLKLDKNRNIAGSKYYSMKSVQIFKAWEKVFGGTQRLVRVMGSMTTNTRLTETLLGFQNAYKYVDAVAIGAYFHIPQKRMTAIKSVDDVFKELKRADNRYSIKNLLTFVHKQAQITKGYGVDLIAYEGGQHLVHHKTHSMTQGATPYLYQANKDPRMAQAYYQLLSGWKNQGGKLFLPFSAPRPSTWHGSWGIKEYISQPDSEAPKYQALLGFIHNNPCWWKNCQGGEVYHHPKPGRIPSFLISGHTKKTRASFAIIPKQAPGQHTLHKTEAKNINKIIQGTIENPRDLTARWRANWDDKYLYIWVGIVDDKFVADSKKQYWADDSIEIYIDADASRSDQYDGFNDYHLSFRMGSPIQAGSKTPKEDISAIRYAMRPNPAGYQLDIAIPWTTLRVIPKPEHTLGFDIQVNDDDNGYSRDAKISWNAETDSAWKSPKVFGELVLSH